ncbi:MAG: beta-glucosidase [Bryobacteraceae bacterium]
MLWRRILPGLLLLSTPLPAALAADQSPEERADALIAQMTLDEKIQLLHGALRDYNPGPLGTAGYIPGIPRLGIPDLHFADGSLGVGNQVGPATVLPSCIASAATWDLALAYDYGWVIGHQSRAYGVNVNLGGNVNLANREPRCGRTFEMKGEDPLLAGRITAAHVRAIQDQGVIGCLKHFALNDQETGRFTADVRISERGARQSDLLAFEIALRESGAQSVMCAYNLVNGVYACENPWLLNTVLKGEWGFRGFVMSDWYAARSSVKAALAGLDQEQPGGYLFGGERDRSLKSAVQEGLLPEARLNDMVRRVLRAMIAVGLLDSGGVRPPLDLARSEAIAQRVAEEGTVLLVNQRLLPLDARSLRSIAVIGGNADRGVLTGGGSAQVAPTGGPALWFPPPCPPCWGGVLWAPSSPLRAIRAMAPRTDVQYDSGADIRSAAALARHADVAIVFAAEWESEGMDLPSLGLSGSQDALIQAVIDANPRTVVVLQSGGAQLMPWSAGAEPTLASRPRKFGPVMPWAHGAAAVLAAWYPGQRGAEAIANILFGAVNPSGKLPLTIPLRIEDLPRTAIDAPPAPDSSEPFPVRYDEGHWVGYRWFDAHGLEPLFPFGFGLSYTTFEFSGLRLEWLDTHPGTRRLAVSFDLWNTGPRAGAEVAQVYLSLPPETGEPPKRLAGWAKVNLNAGERRRVEVVLNEGDASHPFSIWSDAARRWVTPAGQYRVWVGNNAGRSGLKLSSAFRLEAP